MNDNINVARILTIIITPLICIHLLEGEQFLLCVFCVIPWLMYICHLCGNFENYLDLSYSYNERGYNDYTHVTNTYWEKRENESKKLINDVSEKCVLNKNVIEMETLVKAPPISKTTLPPIKEIVAKELEKKEEKVIDGTKKNKPSIDVNSIVVTSHEVIKPQISAVAKEAILIENTKELPMEKMGTYKTIISVLEKEDLLADKKYALYQSFAHIDTLKEGIIIYIDYEILKKAQLTKEHLHEKEIIEALKTAMHCEQLVVIFDEYKPKTLLNYFLETKCYGTKC